MKKNELKRRENTTYVYWKSDDEWWMKEKMKRVNLGICPYARIKLLLWKPLVIPWATRTFLHMLSHSPPLLSLSIYVSHLFLLQSLSLSPFFFLFLCPLFSVCLSLILSVYPFSCLSECLSFLLFVCLSVHSLNLFFFVYLSVPLTVYLSFKLANYDIVIT